MFYILIFIVLNLCTFLIVKYIFCRDLLKSMNDKEIKKEFWPFYRDELDRVSIIWSLPYYIFFWPRFLVGWFIVIICSFIISLLLIGVKDPQNLDPWRAWIVEKFARGMSKIGMAIIGYPIIKSKRVSVEYTKYLGPDWNPEWKGASTLISKHSAWYDGIVAIYLYYPALTVLSTLKWYPFAGKLLMAINTVFIERVG